LTLPEPVACRRRPYPYRAALAICSDLDETPDREVYWETARFLNTTRPTAMGDGVGLEVGNSIYFDMPPDQFAYWNTDDLGRERVRALIRSGHVDCFHSFGDLATTRKDAGRALDELSRHGLSLAVWIDHAVAPTNFGADIMRGLGDVPGSPAYHADLSCGAGVRYVWRGRVTSVVGQDVPRRLGGIFTARHAPASARTLAKEIAKGLSARLGSRKYAMHAPNDLLRGTQLRDGRPVVEFLRSNPHWRAVNQGEKADGLAEVLSPGFLDLLAARGAATIVYTHLGKVRDRREPLPPPTRAALALLAERQAAGQVLVTTTRRLLDYCLALRRLRFEAQETNGALRIQLPADLPSVDGLTFYVPDPQRASVLVGGREVTELSRNPPDDTGRPSVSLPWPRLRFPDA
jgi:hypothetical protein